MLTKFVQAGALALLLIPSVAAAQSCDLSDFDCSKKGNKCNIHFDNRTGLDDSTCKNGNSYSNAWTTKIRAKDDNDKNLGNTISIVAGQKNTMNLDNRQDENGNNLVTSIRVGGQGNFVGNTLSCDEIWTILAGSGKCKIYANRTGYSEIAPLGYAFFDCAGGDVCSSKPANAE